jgi:osmoprotectant transport system permease protein
VLAVAGLIQTVPSMALLALMVPLLGGLIGFLPAFIALTLYSMLPVLGNTITGILEIDPAMTEAARGVGMTDRQSLQWVELPLAAPIILAGIRTATVWVVGMATLSTPVGAPSLGNYIFLGLQTRNWIAVLFGCFFAAALAIVLDQLIRLLERAARQRSPRLAWTAGAALTLILAAGLLPEAMHLLSGSAAPRDAAPRAATIVEESQPSLAGVELSVGSKGRAERRLQGFHRAVHPGGASELEARGGRRHGASQAEHGFDDPLRRASKRNGRCFDRLLGNDLGHDHATARAHRPHGDAD